CLADGSLRLVSFGGDKTHLGVGKRLSVEGGDTLDGRSSPAGATAEQDAEKTDRQGPQPDRPRCGRGTIRRPKVSGQQDNVSRLPPRPSRRGGEPGGNPAGGRLLRR